MKSLRPVALAVLRAGKVCVRYVVVALRVVLTLGLVALFAILPMPILPWRTKSVRLPANRDEQGEVLKKD